MSDEGVAAVLASHGSGIVTAKDPAALAETLAARLDAELLDSLDDLEAAIARRFAVLADRLSAHTALELHARLDDADEAHVVTTIAGLRRLVERIADADALVTNTIETVRARADAATGLAVHPDSIRAAAAEVVEARATVVQAEAALAEAVAVLRPTPAEAEADDTDAASSGAGGATDRRRGTLDRTVLVRLIAVVAVSVVVGVLVLVAAGSPAGLVLPVVALGWAGVESVRRRDDAADEELASANLAAVAALTDQAYGGAPVADDDASPALDGLRSELATALERLRYAESSWRSLVGPDADVDDLESILQARDPQHGTSVQAVERTASVVAVAGHRRRLHAQWKLAWWALDRPVPPLTDADSSIAALESAGVEAVTVPTHAARTAERDRTRYEELAAGRSADELEADATAPVTSVVVVDLEGAVSPDDLESRTGQLPDEVRVLVVGPAAPEGSDD